MLNKQIILHLTLIEGIGPHSIQKIVQKYRSGVKTSDLYLLSQSDWMQHFDITENVAHKLVSGLANKKILEKELYLIAEHNIQVTTLFDENYPQLLKEIYSPPIVLYSWGASWSDVNKCIAVVGARKANEYGRRIVNTIIPDLVAAGYTIVSGGALGVDSMAHEAALQSNGKTIAILGSGLLRPYPPKNKYLFKKIIENAGIVASSFPLMMDPLPGHFPARNRIVTGLSQGCLVVQAAQKSGALISAHCAMEQGREVFAVPGLFDDELSIGCHEIIQQGAKLVTSSADIFNEFGDRVILSDLASLSKVEFDKQQMVFQATTIKAQETSVQVYSEVQQKILAVCKQHISLEDIIMRTGISFEQTQVELFNLQLEGAISQDFTGMWIAIQ